MIKLVVEMMQQKYFLLVSLLPQFLYFLYISQILISHIQLLIFKYVLSACFGFAFCLLYGESEDWKIWLCPQGLTQSRTSVGPPYHTCTLLHLSCTLHSPAPMPLFRSGTRKQGKEHKIWNWIGMCSRASVSFTASKIQLVIFISQDYCEN